MASNKKRWFGLVSTSVAIAMAAGGCTRVSSAWSVLTAKPQPPEALDPESDSDAAAPVAQGDQEPATPDADDSVAASSNVASTTYASNTVPSTSLANSGAVVVDLYPPAASSEPVRAPAVNVFGEIDGQQPKGKTEPGDFGFQQHTFSDEGYDADINVDGTGRWMVYSSTHNSERPEIYLQRTDGTTVTQLTSDPSENAQPCFSPDGKSIAFCSTRAGSWDLYTMDIDGRNVTQITSGPSQDMHPSFSPDGSRLVYSSIGGRSGQWEIWVVTLATRERKMVGYGLFPTWSPEKGVERIAYQRARQRGSRWFSLWTLDLADGEARRITEVAVSSNSAIISPCWSPDGKRLAFSTVVDPAQTNKGKPRGQQDIWVIDADGGGRHRLTDGTSACLSPYWAGDRVYFISDRGGHENVWSVKAEAANVWPIANRNAKDAPGATGGPKSAVGSSVKELEN
jgi:WD40 repeat protein